MAISLRSSGAWTAASAPTQTVTLPAHAAGDLLIVRAACKPWSATITCGTSGWAAAGAQYANGTTPASSGAGSLAHRVFWKIATSSSEPSPVIAWATTGTPGMAVALAYQKGAGETWVTPVGAGGGDATSRTAQSCTIGSHVSVTAGDLVDYFLTEDDNHAITVPTIAQTGVTFDAAVIAPASALSTGTGFDAAASGGYRIATSGTSSAAAIATATFSAIGQGGAYQTRLRVTTASPVTVTPDPATLLATPLGAAVAVSDHKVATPPKTTLLVTRQAPVLRLGVTPGTATLATTLQAPDVTPSDHKVATPPAVALVTSAQVPIVGRAIVPAPIGLATTRHSAMVALSDHKVVTPTAASLVTTPRVPAALVIGWGEWSLTFDGDVGAKLATIGPVTLVASPLSPVLTSTALATPPAASLTLTTRVPTVNAGIVWGDWSDTFASTTDPEWGAWSLTFDSEVFAVAWGEWSDTFANVAGLFRPEPVALVLTTYAPTVVHPLIVFQPGLFQANVFQTEPIHDVVVTPPLRPATVTTYPPLVIGDVVPGLVALTLTTYSPTVTAGLPVTVTPGVVALETTGLAPTLVLPVTVTPGVAAATLTVFVPGVAATVGLTATPPAPTLVAATFAPTVTASQHRMLSPSPVAVAMTSFAPSLVISDHKIATPPPVALGTTAWPPFIGSAQYLPPHVLASLLATGTITGTLAATGAKRATVVVTNQKSGTVVDE